MTRVRELELEHVIDIEKLLQEIKDNKAMLLEFTVQVDGDGFTKTHITIVT